MHLPIVFLSSFQFMEFFLFKLKSCNITSHQNSYIYFHIQLITYNYKNDNLKMTKLIDIFVGCWSCEQTSKSLATSCPASLASCVCSCVMAVLSACVVSIWLCLFHWVQSKCHRLRFSTKICSCYSTKTHINSVTVILKLNLTSLSTTYILMYMFLNEVKFNLRIRITLFT